MIQLIELVAALFVILLAADLFTNGIEWLGRLFRLGEGAVASVLAAVGTALPETMIPVVAILLAGQQPDPAAARDVGVGAVLGAPFMLSTLAMFVTGLAVLMYRRRRRTGLVLHLNRHVLFQDVGFFFMAYFLALAAAFVPADLQVLRYAVVVVLIGIYVLYVKRHFEVEGSGATDDLAPLRLNRLNRRTEEADRLTVSIRVVALQVTVAVVLIVVGALVFVDAVANIARGAGLDPALLALIVAPIATELPEGFNSLIWIRQGKDTLAVGNITGAMVFQSCIPTAIAVSLAASAWTINADSLLGFASAVIAFISTALTFVPMFVRGALTSTNLLIGGAFYVLYVALVVAHLGGMW